MRKTTRGRGVPAFVLPGVLLLWGHAVAGDRVGESDPDVGARAAAQAPAKLTRAGLKCLSAPAYYPGAGIGYTRSVADEIDYLNPAMLRVEFIGELNPSRSINYPAYDYLADTTGAQGIGVLGLIDYQSIAWTTPADWATDEFRGHFVQRVREIVSRYSARPYSIRAWEIWNEEDIHLPEFYARIDPEPYARLLIESYEAIKSIDSASTVVLGGVSPKGLYYEENYLRDLYQTVAMQDYFTSHGQYPFDVVAVHPYPDFGGFTVPTLKTVLDTHVKSVMDLHGDASKTVWLTEMGWNSCLLGWSVGLSPRQRQADYLTDSFHLIDSQVPYVARYFWFRHEDFGAIDCWGLVEKNLVNHKPAFDAYLALTDPGPEPPPPDFDPGEDPPVWGANSDSALAVQVSSSDLIEGMLPAAVFGGFHTASVGGVERLTNGEFDAELAAVVLRDYAEGEPALAVRYDFPEPVTIYEIRMFAGHTADGGNRAFQSNDVHINGQPVALDLTTGDYGQVSPSTTSSAVSLVRLSASVPGHPVASGVDSLEVRFWCSSSLSLDFRDRWSPYNDPAEDLDGADPAYVSPIIKELDVIGIVEDPGRVKGFIIF